MALVSQFGSVLLGVQDALGGSVKVENGIPRVANLLIISLDREAFLKEQKSDERDVVESFRSALRKEIEEFVAASGWKYSGALSIHLLLRTLEVSSAVRVEHQDVFYEVRVRDDAGTRTVAVNQPKILAGRVHDGPPRFFIPVHDSSRSWSREHLLFTLRDLVLTVRQLGRNATELNEAPLQHDADIVLSQGDIIRCGPQSIEFTSLFI